MHLTLSFPLFLLLLIISQGAIAQEENAHATSTENIRPVAENAPNRTSELVQSIFPHIPKEEIQAMEKEVDKDRIAFYMAMLLSSNSQSSIATLSKFEKAILTSIQKNGMESEKAVSPYLAGLQELLSYLHGNKNRATQARVSNSIEWMDQVWKARKDKDARAFTKALSFKDKKSILIAQALVGEDKGALSAFSALSNGEKNKFYLTIPANAVSKDYFKGIGITTNSPISIQTPAPQQMLPDFIKVSDWKLELIKKIVKESPTAIHDWKESSKDKFNEDAASDALGSEGQAKLLKSMREYHVAITYDAADKKEIPEAMRSSFQFDADDGYAFYLDLKKAELGELKTYQNLVDQGKHEEAFDWMQKHLNEWREFSDMVDLFIHPKKELEIPIPKKGTLEYMKYEESLGKYAKQARPKNPSPVSEIIDSVKEIHEGLYLMGVAGHGDGKDIEIINGLKNNLIKISSILKDTIELKGTEKQRGELDKALKEILFHLNSLNFVHNSSSLNEKLFLTKIQKPLDDIIKANFDILEFVLPKIFQLLKDSPSKALKEEASKQIEATYLPKDLKEKILEKIATIQTKEDKIRLGTPR